MTMSHPDWNKIDKFDESFPVSDCVFLDILGYKEHSKKYFDKRFNLLARINRALERVAIEFTLTAPLLDLSDLSVEIISDSVIMFQPCKPHGLATLLLYAGSFTANFGLEGLYLRGGIARGLHSRCQTTQGFDFLASQALQKAYELESKKANYARILIEPDIVSDLAPEERNLVVREENDYILHFANRIINRDGNNFDNVYAEMTEILEGLNQQTDDRIKAKHRWLLDYYYWTLSQNPKWDIKKFSAFAPENRRFSFLD